MIYPDNFEFKIGFHEIRDMLRSRCLSPLGIVRINNMAFMTDADAINASMEQIREMKRIRSGEEDFPLNAFFDIRESMKRLRMTGTFLEETELFELMRTLATMNDVVAFLKRYADDERIGMIAGLNVDEKTTDIGTDDYFFTTNFSIWGWASWSRVIGKRSADYAFLDDAEAVSRLQALTEERKLRRDFLPMCQAHRLSGKAYFETIFQSQLLLQSQMTIVPRVNMINNVGVTDDSTHFAGSISTLPHGYRRIFTMGRYDLVFPLKHPRYVVEHVEYRHRVYRTMGWRSPWIKVGRSLEELYLNVKHGNWAFIAQSVRNRIRKWMGKTAYR